MHPTFLLRSSTPLPNLSSASATCFALHAPKDEACASLACMQRFVFKHARVFQSP